MSNILGSKRLFENGFFQERNMAGHFWQVEPTWAFEWNPRLKSWGTAKILPKIYRKAPCPKWENRWFSGSDFSLKPIHRTIIESSQKDPGLSQTAHLQDQPPSFEPQPFTLSSSRSKALPSFSWVPYQNNIKQLWISLIHHHINIIISIFISKGKPKITNPSNQTKTSNHWEFHVENHQFSNGWRVPHLFGTAKERRNRQWWTSAVVNMCSPASDPVNYNTGFTNKYGGFL